MKGNLMSLRQKYRRILSGIIPAGAAGVSLLLGTMAQSLAAAHPAGLQPSTEDRTGISERLAAIRDAVSEVTEAEGEAAHPNDGDLHLAWGNWWNNGGWGRPWGGWGWPNWNNWRNWNNWNNWWRNW
jgi:hypothetical protein